MPRPEQHEQARDEQDSQRLVEGEHVIHRHDALARQGQAHHRHRQQAGLFANRVGRGEAADDRCEGRHVVQLVGDHVARESEHENHG